METRPYESHVAWQSINKIQAILQMTGQAVIKKMACENKSKLVILKFILQHERAIHKDSFYKKAKNLNP